jgi:chemotaxis protein methyltransferase CheR
MVVALTTNHTHFFRENHHFDHLRDHVLPQLQARARAGQKVRIWSAGCSSGEEVYSIAMTLAGESGSSAAWLKQGDVRMLATDIAPHVVAAVERACYSENTVQPIPAAYRRQWLQQEGPDRHVVSDALRSLVTGRILNLFQPWPMRQKYDAIFCRNVMIYFDDRAKAELEARFVDVLAPGGLLYIGHSERLIGPAAELMEPVGQTIYVKQRAAR